MYVFEPRRTKILKLAEKHGWATVADAYVISHLIKEQGRLWTGEETVQTLDRKVHEKY